MDVRQYAARFMVHKVGSFVVKDRVLCFAANGFSTYDPETQQLTNTWSYDDVDSASPLDGETDFVIYTPRHRIKKTVYRCHFRMEILVCLMRLRSLYQAKSPGKPIRPELQAHVFPCFKVHKRGLQSACVVEIGPDGVYQKDDEGELMSHIPYTSLVSIDLVCDDHNAIVLNHSDNSSLFIVDKRTEMAQAIHRVMRAYGMQINEYRKKTMDAATRAATREATDHVSFQYPVVKVSSTNKPLAPRLLSVSDQYIAELSENGTAISSRPISRIFALILYADSNEAFAIVYVDGIRRTFYSSQREKLIAELLVSCHALKNTQVEVVGDHFPDALRMVPCKTLQSEGAKLVGQPKDHVFDRELRAVQSSILLQFATHGASKTTRMQRQLPLGIDDGMHQLALEFNANTAPSGVIAQPNKPFDKAMFFVAREIRDIVNRHGIRHPFLATYLQTLYRLLPAPPALKEFVGILLERGDGYLATISELLAGRHSLTVYWTLMVLHRLLETKTYKLQCREILLGNGAFLSTVMSLFDLDPKTQRYMSDLPTMKLCQLTLCLVKTNPERQLALSKTLHDQLARRFRLLHRILFGFPALGTVEACVGILARMTNNPSTVYVGRGDGAEAVPAAPLSSSSSSSSSAALMARAVQPPPLSMGFGEHLTYDLSTNRPSRRSIMASRSSAWSTRSVSATDAPKPVAAATEASGVVVQNPQVLLRQYRLFLETPYGAKKQPLEYYSDATHLRLRYRSRTVFLQELLSHVAGRFDDFQRVFSVECIQFSGFLGKTSGQREKSELYLTPRGLIAVRVMNRSTQEFEYRAMQSIALPAANRDSFAMTVKNKLLYVYSDSRTQLVEKIRDLAGVLGLRLRIDHVDELPKPNHRASITSNLPVGWDASSAESVTKRSGRHGFFRFRKKQIVVLNGLLLEADTEKATHKSFSLKELRRVVCTPCPPGDASHDLPSSTQLLALDFADGARRAYLTNSSDSMTTLLAKVYDGCLFSQNHWVTLSPAFSHVNPRLTARALLQSNSDKTLFLESEGLFVVTHRELVKEMDKLADGGATAIERVLFSLELLTLNVEEDDFGSATDSRIAQLSFRSLFHGFTIMLTHMSQAPIRPHAITVILAAFCRINHGCYRLASDETSEHMQAFVDRLVAVLDTCDDSLAKQWAVITLHSLCVDARRSASHKQAEKTARALVLGHARVISSVVGLVERASGDPLCALAALDMLYDVAVKSRSNTDNNQFDAVIKALSIASASLQRLATQRTVVGLAVYAAGLLKVTLDHTDGKTHLRMCDAALESGLTLRSVYSALFCPTDAGRAAYQYIAGMWTVHHRPSFELLTRLVPPGLIRMLSTPQQKKSLLSHHEANQKGRAGKTAAKKLRDTGGAEWFIRRLRQEISAHLPDAATSSRIPKVQDDGTRANYPGESASDIGLLAELIQRDFFLPDLIWNARTREELRLSLERAIDMIDKNADVSHDTEGLAAPLVWNHRQFEAAYPSLADEVVVENVYLRVLITRVHDGSLVLEDVARHVDTRAVHTSGESATVFYAALEIAKHPVTFYHEVYQRWLELRLCGSRSRTSTTQQLRMSELVTQAPACDLDLLMKTMIEAARAFPSVRSIPSPRVQFLMDLVAESIESQEATDLLDLLARLSADVMTSRSLATAQHLTTLLFIAVLSHRRPLSAQRRIVEDGDELPVIGLDVVPEISSTSSMPLTHLSGEGARLSYGWSVRSRDALVDGPFSVMQLQQHLESLGDASIEAVVICCCSIHDKHDSSVHEWRPLAQFPELRWLELVAEPIDVASFGGHALSILRNVVVSEPSYSTESGAYLVPMPVGKQLLSAKDKLAHVVQLLLVDDVEVRELACEILQALGPASGPKLFEFGLFFFLFAVDVSETTPFIHETKLLQMFHRVQASHETRHPGQSYLLEMLPEPLIALLDAECPDDFADAFTGRATDKRVLWTPSMRSHLRSMVREHIEEFEEDLKRDVAATYCYVSLPPVQYTELSRDVYCSGYFLSTIAHGDEHSLDAIEEPQVLMASIEDKWRSLQQRQSMAAVTLHPVEEESASAFTTFGWPSSKKFDATELRVRYRDLCKKGAAVATVRAAYDRLSSLLERKREVASGRTSDEVIECILLAQLRLLDKFSFQFFSYESKALSLLLETIASSERSDFSDLALRILHKLLAAAPLNIDKVVAIEGVWDTVLDMVDHVASVRDHSTKLAGFSVLELLLASSIGPQSLLRNGGEAPRSSVPSSAASRLVASSSDDIEDDNAVSLFVGPAFHSQAQLLETDQSRRLCKLLEGLLSTSDQRQPWQIQKQLFGVVVLLCHNRHLQEQLVLSTKLFWRALYMLLSTAEDVARGPESATSGDESPSDVMALKERDVVEAAFLALRALSVGSDGNSRSHALDALANLLPMEFLDCLDRPSGHDFWMILSTEIREPTCIWNDHTRSELMQLIVDHCNDDDDDELLFLESSRSYMYDCLKAEPLVGGIYLRILLAKAEDDLETITAECLFPITPQILIESLFVLLNENRDPSLGIYADTLPALECLNVLVDIPIFKEAFVDALEHFADSDDSENESVSVATLGRYLLPFDRSDKCGMSISSRRSLSSYGFMSKNGMAAAELDGLPAGMEAEFGNVDYLNRQEYALLILNKICGLEYNLEKLLAPFCRYAWSLQVIADHLDYEQAFYALSCLAELCDTCLVVAEYVEQSGLWVEILGIALQSRQHVLHEHFLRAEALREPAFEVLYALLAKDFAIRESMYSGLGRFLPYPMVYQIHLDPGLATKFFDDNHEKSDLIWNSHWRTEVRRVVDDVICRNRVERTKAKRDSVILDEHDYVHMPENFIAGLYLDHFLARPDPENLTNPAYNLELLFQEWKDKLHCLMGFDLENPPQFLKDLAAEVEQLTAAMVHILRAPLNIEESIEAFDMPNDIVKLVRHCNKHVVAGFPYRCTLRIARRLATFSHMQSKDFLELLFCRITIDHPDVPALIKVVRRVLEARSQGGTLELDTDAFVLKDLAYFTAMVKYLESIVELKDAADAQVLSNVNRILRIVKAEQRQDTHEVHPMSQSFFQRASGRWHNFTLTETLSRLGTETATPSEVKNAHMSFDVDATPTGFDVDVPRSFDVDAEHERMTRASNDTFNVDEERAANTSFMVAAPPKSYIFDGETIQELPPAPTSYRYVNGVDDAESAVNLVRASTIRATYEPVDSQYHSTKAAEYDRYDEDAQRSRRASLSNMAATERLPAAAAGESPAPSQATYDRRGSDASLMSFGMFSAFGSEMSSSRRYSLLDSWRAPTSNQPNPLLSNMTISRRGRRAAAVYSRRKTHQSNRWFK